MPKRVTLKDVAERMGVSVTTVSRALKNRPDIGEETKAKIVALVEEMGYVPNMVAAGLRLERMPFVGAVIMDSANPFFAGVLRGIQDVAYGEGYQTVLCNTDFNSVHELESIRLLEQLRVAGILLYPAQTDPEGSPQSVEAMLRSGPPVVLMGRYYEDIEANWVIFDNPLGGYLATHHALERGYSKVAYLAGERGTSATERRYEGYRRALQEYDLPTDPSLVIWGGRGVQDGRTGFSQLIAKHRPPFAVFCLNDLVAIGALAVALEMGLKVPDDVAVIGYDDIELATVVSVPLTTVASSAYSLGETASRLLLDVLSGEKEAAGHHVVLEPHLVVRQSC